MSPIRKAALPTSLSAPTPRISSSRATPLVTIDRGEPTIHASQYTAPNATRLREMKRARLRVSGPRTEGAGRADSFAICSSPLQGQGLGPLLRHSHPSHVSFSVYHE